jgi:hypothetical protein
MARFPSLSCDLRDTRLAQRWEDAACPVGIPCQVGRQELSRVLPSAIWLPERWRPFGDPGMNFGLRAWANMAECSPALFFQRYAVGCSTGGSVAQGGGTVNDTTGANDVHGRFPMAMRLMV